MKKKTKPQFDVNEKGAALITAIFAILLVTLIGTALHYTAAISLTVAVNERDNVEAFYIADAGISHAAALISKTDNSKYSSILTAAATAPNTGDELSVPPTVGLWTTAESIPAGNASGGGVVNFGAGGKGRYYVSVRNDTAIGETPTKDLNGILIVTSTGVGRDGATATVETVVKGTPPLPALLINGNATLSGSVSVQGTNGVMHANGLLDINGGPCAEQYFSTSLTVTGSNKTKGAGCSGPGVVKLGQPIIEPPIYNIRNEFYGKTDYIMGVNGANAGKVFTGAGVLVADATKTGNKWTSGSAQWIWQPAQAAWVQSGNSILNASFYSEGNIAIYGNFGTSTSPAQVTFIAEGCIYNQGKQYMIPKYQNFSLVAGTDLKIAGRLISGSDDLELEGITYALHQIEFSGTPILKGPVVAANQADTNSPGGFNLVPLVAGFMVITGNPTISVDGRYGGKVNSLTWREIRR